MPDPGASPLDTLSDKTSIRWHPASAATGDERIVATGHLVFDEPLRLGNGDADDFLDHVLLRTADGRPLLTGATLAGALRALLTRHDAAAAPHLFGSAKGTEALSTSRLIVDDATGERADGAAVGIDVRQGVALNGHTRTPADGLLYDAEAWGAGVRFPVRLEVTVPSGDGGDAHRAAFASLLGHVREPGIELGSRTSRGFGHGAVARWHVRRYAPASVPDLTAWLRRDALPAVDDVGAVLGAAPVPLDGHAFALDATFELDGGGLMIRAGVGQDDRGPDAVHLHRSEGAARRPVVSGTSLAGALRAHASRIAHTLSGEAPPHDGTVHTRASRVVDGMFGPRPSVASTMEMGASRLRVRESVVEGGASDLVQQRVSLDRFTGGAYPGALFAESPIVGAARVRVSLRLPERPPSRGDADGDVDGDAAAEPASFDAEVGLLMLVLKDLWTGLVPIGGGHAVGRGRLRGLHASLSLPDVARMALAPGAPRLGLTPEAAGALDARVGALVAHLRRAAPSV